MTIAGSSESRMDKATGEAPRAIRLAIAASVVLALGSAMLLMAERGPALLLDLAHMGARFFCL